MYTAMLLLFTFLQPLSSYRSIDGKDIIGMRFAHYYDENRKHKDKDFSWTFQEGKFVITTTQDALPKQVLNSLGITDAKSRQITGKWQLEADPGQKLKLFDLVIDGKPSAIVAKLVIFRSAPTVIRVDSVQYVFGIR